MWPFERPNAPTSHIGGSGPVTGYRCFRDELPRVADVVYFGTIRWPSMAG